MPIKFEDVQAVDDKVIFQTSRKCCKNFNRREITHRQYEVELWFFHIASVLLQQTQMQSFTTIRLEMTKNYSRELSNSRANNSSNCCSGLITPIIKLIRDLKVMYILTKFGSKWLIFVDATV